jgi:hypothetical protein
MPTTYAYSANIISQWLKEHNIPHKPSNSTIDSSMSLYNHGIRAMIYPDTEISIQTHHAIAGPAFAETAFIIDNKVSYDNFLGYNNYDAVIRHSSPSDLFNHIHAIRNMLQQRDGLWPPPQDLTFIYESMINGPINNDVYINIPDKIKKTLAAKGPKLFQDNPDILNVFYFVFHNTYKKLIPDHAEHFIIQKAAEFAEGYLKQKTHSPTVS